jgi:ATP-binding cassette subfamily B protein
MPNQNLSPPASSRQLLWRYLRPQRARVFWLTLFLLSSIALQLINPQLVRRFLDAVEMERTLGELVRTALLFIGIALIAQLIRVIGTYFGEQVAWTATNDLRADLAEHCLRLDMAFHKTHKPGELIERVDGDVNQLANFFSQLVIQLASNLLLMVGVLVLLWLIDWRVGVSITLIALAGILTLNAFRRFTVPRWQRLREIEADLFGYLEEWLHGTAVLQTNNGRPYVLGRLSALLRRRWLANRSAMRWNLGIMGLPILVPALAYIAAFLWGERLFAQSVLTVGTVYLIIYYVNILESPLWVLQRQIQDLQRASAAINRIVTLFTIQPTLHDGPGAALPAGPLGITFAQVSFQYEDDPYLVLDSIDFHLAPGRTLGLIGRTGSGKSTLVRLLNRFYDPGAGAIMLGAGETAVDLRTLTAAQLRRRVAMVTQEVQLFHATLRDNLTLFDETIPDETIRAALQDLELDRWLAGLPDGLDTQLAGADGLSAGEAQLLALGRAFLRDPSLVILDEASSRLDPVTEQLLERGIDRLLHGRTGVIIAHRLHTVQRADEIMILQHGRVVEHGLRAALAADPESQFARLLKTGLEAV